jgi:Kef-type K+ transport system membrane component KefB
VSLSSESIAQMLVSLGLLLTAAHVLGYVFARLHQPRVIGEILGGLLLGPTLLSSAFPGAFAWIFPSDGPTPAILGAVYQLGLMLLMYCSGAEMRSLFRREERKVVTAITAGGIFVPFAAGLALVSVISTGSLEGPNAGHAPFVLVFGIAIAVTSIPVISKILFDLGIIGTSFSRVVLGAAVVEDVVLYIALAIALGLAGSGGSTPFGIPGILGLSPASGANVIYHVVSEVAFIGLALAIGPRLFRWALGLKLNLLKRSDHVAYQMAFVFALATLSLFLGVVPLFGAFVAGIVAGTSTSERVIAARESIKRFSFAFFIPIYFAIVGLQLDLVRSFDPLFFLGILAFATAIKAVSVYVGARAVGEDHTSSTNLAIAMNARGGPGIVLASVAFDAGIVSRSFFATLVMLAVVTSLFAGAWLDRIVRKNLPLRAGERPRDVDEGAGTDPVAETTRAGVE